MEAGSGSNDHETCNMESRGWEAGSRSHITHAGQQPKAAPLRTSSRVLVGPVKQDQMSPLSRDESVLPEATPPLFSLHHHSERTSPVPPAAEPCAISLPSSSNLSPSCRCSGTKSAVVAELLGTYPGSFYGQNCHIHGAANSQQSSVCDSLD